MSTTEQDESDLTRFSDPEWAEVLVSRVTHSDPSEKFVYEVCITHRPSRRRFRVRMNAESFALMQTGMGGVYGKFEEIALFKGKRKEAK